MFGIGLVAVYEKVVNYLGGRKSKFMICILLSLICVIVVWPMWTGKILNFKLWERSSMVKIPDDYADADHWLVKQKEDFRVISYPVTNYDGVVYSWKHGYCGDSPEFLLLGNKPYIGITFWTDENFEKITKMLPDVIYRENALKKIAPLLNVKYLLLHNDLDKSI